MTAPLLAASIVQAQIWGDVVTEYSTAELAAIFENANASNTISMPFYDLSQNYTKDAKNDTDWELDLRIVADIAVPDSDNEFVTGFQLSLVPPSSMSQGDGQLDVAEDQWYTCQSWIIMRKVKEDEIHPRCEGMVSDECFEALQRAADSEECMEQQTIDVCTEGNDATAISSCKWDTSHELIRVSAMGRTSMSFEKPWLIVYHSGACAEQQHLVTHQSKLGYGRR